MYHLAQGSSNYGPPRSSTQTALSPRAEMRRRGHPTRAGPGPPAGIPAVQPTAARPQPLLPPPRAHE